MKRFFIISLLALLVVPSAWPCAWVETHNYYLFSVYDRTEFRERVDKISLDNWKAYMGIELNDDNYFYFDADEITEAAKKKNDALMVSYVRQLVNYLDCVRLKEREQYEWDYPTAEEREAANKMLNVIRDYAQGQLSSRLRSQHALLFMRCNMMLGRHAENVRFWEQTASKYIETVYKDMMKNIYAGALLKVGRDGEAGQIFAEQGDWQSLMTQFYLKRSYQAILQEYQRNPQSAVLPFLLQDFVNNAQEAVDNGDPGKLFVRDIQRSEAQQMIQLAGKAATEGKTQWPALWMGAKAWLEFLYDNKTQAAADIRQAATMEGTQRMKDNVRVLQFYISAMTTKPSSQFDDYVAQEVQWLNSQRDVDYHYANALDRIVHQALCPQYEAAGRHEVSLALLTAAHSYNGDLLDEMPVEGVLAYMDYVKKPATTALDKVLKVGLEYDDTAMTDLVGTKYLRLCQWQKAISWLERVPITYYREKGYAPYAVLRSYTVEPWVKRQWLTDEQAYGNAGQQLRENPKLKFAREMLQMESELPRLKGLAFEQRCFDLAVRYAQADFRGDCWFLMRDGKSINDKLRPNEANLSLRAVNMLRKASQTTDQQLKERALFALCYVYLNDDTWYSLVWSDRLTDYVRQVQPATQHYKNWAALLNYQRQTGIVVPRYMTLCDEYVQFKHIYR